MFQAAQQFWWTDLTSPMATQTATARSKKMASPEVKPSLTANAGNAAEQGESALLSTLNDDLILTILSFLVDLPWDNPSSLPRAAATSLPGDDDDDDDWESTPANNNNNNSNSSASRCNELTTVLPVVCKTFYKFCHHPTDYLWRFLLDRLLKQEPYLWEDACHSLLEEYRTTVGSVGQTQRLCGTDGVQQRRDEDDANDNNNNSDSSNNGNNGDGEPMQQSAHDNLSTSSNCEGSADVKKAAGNCDTEAQRRKQLLDDTCSAMIQLIEHDQKYQRVTPSLPAFSLRTSQRKVDSSVVRGTFQTTVQGGSTCQCVIRRIVTTYMRCTKPVFYMPSSLRLGRDFGLHFFEPRYRMLIGEVMEVYPLSARRGEPIQLEIEEEVEVLQEDDEENKNDGTAAADAPPKSEKTTSGWLNFFPRASSTTTKTTRPRRRRTLRRRRLPPPSFVYAHEAPLNPNSPACMVQVKRCVIHPDGRADVLLMPTCYVLIERLRIRENSGGLYEAQVRRLGRAASERLEGGPVVGAVGGRRGRNDDDDNNTDDDADDDDENGGGEGGAGFGQVHQGALRVLHGAFVEGPNDILRLLQGAVVEGPQGREIRIPIHALLQLAANRNGGAENNHNVANDGDNHDDEEENADEEMNRAEE